MKYATTAIVAGIAITAAVQSLPAIAQNSENPQQQAAAQGKGLSEAISTLEQARKRIDGAQQAQIQPAVDQALNGLQQAEGSLSGIQPQQAQSAREDIRTARNTLESQPPQKQAALQAVDRVVQRLRDMQQQTGQAQPGGAEINVQQRSAEVQVQQKAPQVTVQQPPPQVTIQQPQPEVTVQQPEPKVTVEQAKPQVHVEQQEPKVTVQQGQPQVRVEQQGQPQVSVEKQGQPQVSVEKSAAAGEAGRSEDTARSQVASMGRGLVGKTIYDSNNSNIGEVEDVTLGTDNMIQAVLVDVGGFLGMGAKRVAIPIDQLSLRDDKLTTSMTKNQVGELPEHDTRQ